MSHEQVTEIKSRIVLGIMAGSGAYDLFKDGSDFFKLLAPYLTFASFVIYVIINWDAITNKLRKFLRRK